MLHRNHSHKDKANHMANYTVYQEEVAEWVMQMHTIILKVLNTLIEQETLKYQIIVQKLCLRWYSKVYLDSKDQNLKPKTNEYSKIIKTLTVDILLKWLKIMN